MHVELLLHHWQVMKKGAVEELLCVSYYTKFAADGALCKPMRWGLSARDVRLLSSRKLSKSLFCTLSAKFMLNTACGSFKNGRSQTNCNIDLFSVD